MDISGRKLLGVSLLLAIGAAGVVSVERGPSTTRAPEAIESRDAHRTTRARDGARAARALRDDFGAHADEVLDRAPSIEALESGFALSRCGETDADGARVEDGQRYSMTLPDEASDAITFHVADRAPLRVREVSARGRVEEVGGRRAHVRTRWRPQLLDG